MQDTQSESTTLEALRDYPRFTYIEAEDFPDGLIEVCPFCLADMLPGSDEQANDRYCPNDDCRFYRSATVRQVYRALRLSDYTIADAAEACEEIPADADRFTIDSRDKAEWLLKKLSTAGKSIAEIVAFGEREKAAIDERVRQCTASYQRTLDGLSSVFGPQLEEVVRGELKGGKAKSLQFVYGKAGVRTVAGKTVIDDKDAAFAMIRGTLSDEEQCRLLRTTVEIVPSEVKKDLLDSDLAQQWDGLAHIEGAGDKFYFDARLPEVL